MKTIATIILFLLFILFSVGNAQMKGIINNDTITYSKNFANTIIPNSKHKYTKVVNTIEPLSASLTNLNSQNFPFIYMNIAVDTFGVGFPGLTVNNFTAYENDILQTDYFNVIPPTEGSGIRLADIIFILDITGSMEDEINAVKTNMLSFIEALNNSDVDFNIGLVVYADDNYTYNAGQLYSDALEAMTVINSVTLGEQGLGGGNYEPEDGFDALKAATLFSFRPGSQRIFIMLTDAPSHFDGDESIYPDLSDGDVTNYTRETIIADLLSAEATVYCVADDIGTNTWGYELYNYQYNGPGSLTESTGGEWYSIYDNFNNIILDIQSEISNNYLVRYKSSSPVFDGVEREVKIVVTYNADSDTVYGYYIPGASPQIFRTDETIELHNQTWTELTEFTIEVEVIDNVVPLVQTVTLYYRQTGTTSYNSVSMSFISGNIYRGIIPSYVVLTPGIDYYITATDGQSTVSAPSVDPAYNPYQLAVLPNIAPAITHTPVSGLTLGVSITISANIIDNTNSLAAAKLFYRKIGQLVYQDTTMTNSGDNDYQALIPVSYVTADGIEYYIKATDDFGVSSFHGLPDFPHIILLGRTINLISPNGGENWQVNSNRDITWTSDNITNVKLEYSTNSGTDWITITNSTSANADSYSWTVPNTPTVNALVRISDANDETINDVSDAVFSIIAPEANPYIPIISYPTGGVTVYTNSPTINWYFAVSIPPLTCHLQLSTTSDFSSLEIEANDISTLYYLVNNLTPGNTYYIRVRSKTTSGIYSQWSTTDSFTVFNSGNVGGIIPKFSYPNNGVTVWWTSIALNWYITVGNQPLTFHVQVSLFNDMSNPFIDVDNITACSYMLNGLTPNLTYYMRIRSRTSDGIYSPFSPIDNFYVNGNHNIPSIPVFSYPTGGITVYTNNPALSWYLITAAPELRFHLQIALDNQFNSIIINVDDINGIAYTTSGLNYGTTYYARVRSKLPGGNTYSAWSNVGSFTVFSNNMPVVPLLGNPIDGITLNTSELQLSWYLNTPSSELKYDLEFTTDTSSASINYISEIDSLSFVLKNLAGKGEYFWRVRSKNNDGMISQASEWESFTIAGVTSMSENGIIPEKFEVTQNYPNPFNPNTTVEFGIPKPSHVTIKIFDMLGREVRTLVDEFKNAGSYRIKWNGENDYRQKVVSGTYIYRIIAGEYSQSMKMLLLK